MGKKPIPTNSYNSNSNNYRNNNNEDKSEKYNERNNKYKDNKSYKQKDKNISNNKSDVNLNSSVLDEIDLNTDEGKLLKYFGFNEFNTSKNKDHRHSDLSGVFLGSKVKSKFRQYMNRKGGFNKTLDHDK